MEMDMQTCLTCGKERISPVQFGKLGIEALQTSAQQQDQSVNTTEEKAVCRLA